MLKQLVNSARIDFEIVPIDPLLVNSGRGTVSGVDMSFVRTYSSGEKDEPFIPGSSLKGVMRSHAEKICRSLRHKPVPVCLPYVAPGKEDASEKGQASCGLRFEAFKKSSPKAREALTSQDAYRLSCPICRLFGSHVFAGRFAVSDAYLTYKSKAEGAPKLEIRDGVAIDRVTGGAAKSAKYEMEVLTKGEFATTLEIRNFERWQLGLVGLVLRDMEDGLVRIGFGKSRGLGRFQARIMNFRLTSYRRKMDGLCGIWKFLESERDRYGLVPESGKVSASLSEPETTGLRYEYDMTETWKQSLKPAVQDFVEYIETVNWPKDMENFFLRSA